MNVKTIGINLAKAFSSGEGRAGAGESGCGLLGTKIQ